ncbi:unnamed protein product, partial [Effrenium voratum]
ERFHACAEEPCSDEALLGHMAIAALGLIVDCRPRKLQTEVAAAACQELPEGDLGQLQVASSRPYACVRPPSVQVLPVPLSGDHSPRWLPGTGCAMPLLLEGLAPEPQQLAAAHDCHGQPTVPVTYATCVFLSPLAPEKRVVVPMALVDTGSSDCELRQGLLDRLRPLPVAARGVVYETVAGRHVFDSLEVLVAIEGRLCAACVTGIPEERFLPGAEDPASDEAVLGLASLSALKLVVHCPERRVVLRSAAANSSVADITHRVPFDDVAKKVASGSILSLVPNSIMEQASFDEYNKYFRSKSRAGVARLDGSLALYVMPCGEDIPALRDSLYALGPHIPRAGCLIGLIGPGTAAVNAPTAKPVKQ